MSVISSTKLKLTVLGRNCMNCPKLLGSTVNFDKGTQYSHNSKNKYYSSKQADTKSN